MLAPFFLSLLLVFAPAKQEEQWQNPPVDYELGPRETAIKQFPYTEIDESLERGDVEGFYEFRDRMSDHFAVSNLSPSQADLVYKIIKEEKIISHGSYGMPAPKQPKIQVKNAKPAPEKTELEKIKENASIKKVGKNHFEMFYSYQSCGVKYVYLSFSVTDSKMHNRKTIEKWSGSYPC